MERKTLAGQDASEGEAIAPAAEQPQAVEATIPPIPRRRGRPPLPPRTEIGRWLRDANLTVKDFAGRLRQMAEDVGLSADDAPAAKTLLDAVTGRHWPHLQTVLLIRYATDGSVDVQHWVKDIRLIRAGKRKPKGRSKKRRTAAKAHAKKRSPSV